MRTRNTRAGDDSKSEEESNLGIATSVRSTRRDTKVKEIETKVKDCEKVSSEMKEEKIIVPTARERRSRNRETRDETINETKNPKSKSFNSDSNVPLTPRKMIECPSVSGLSCKPLSKCCKPPNGIDISLALATTVNGHSVETTTENLDAISPTDKDQNQSEGSSTEDDQPSRQDEFSSARKFNILIATTGSVATVKLIELITTLRNYFPRQISTSGRHVSVTIDIRVVMTENAKHFTAPDKILDSFDRSVKVHDDKEEWTTWNKMGDEILHIELRKWADIFLIAPLDANTMGKLANGICDNLLTCTARAWDISKPLIFCPAMNVHMYEHPLTGEQISKLQSFGYTKVDCIAKKLACGDIGMGAMASVGTIVEKLVATISDICKLQDRPSSKGRVNIIPSSVSSHLEARVKPSSSTDTRKNDHMSILPIRPKIDLPQVHNFESTSNRKRRRKSNPDGSDELHDDDLKRPRTYSNNLGYFAPKFSSVNSLSVTIPSLRNNRSSLGLTHSISIKPKTTSSNSTIIVHQPRALCPDGGSMLVARSSQSDDKIISSSDCGPTYINQKRLINLSNSERTMIRLESDLVSLGSNQAKKHDVNSNGIVNHNNREQNGSEEINNSDLTDFDPSNLLEQTMITDEAIIIGEGATNATTRATTGMDNKVSINSRLQLNGSPLIDIRKFLTMCYHQDTNSFKCAICKNLYKNRKSMARHLKEQHVDGPIFSCEACNVSYKRREKLVKHAREKHLHDNMFPQYLE